MEQKWFVYILRCADDTLYCGVTTEVARRVAEHNDAKIGAKYTKVRRPVVLVYQEPRESRSAALIREYQIKLLTRQEKIALIESSR